MSQFDNFTEHATERARRALSAAQNLASQLGHTEISTEHLLLGLVSDRTSVAARTLVRLGVDLDELANAVLASATGAGTDPQQVGLSGDTKRAIEMAVQEASELHHYYLGTEHLLLGLLRQASTPAAAALHSQGVTLQEARGAIVAILNAGPMGGGWPLNAGMTAVDWPPEEVELLFRHLGAFLNPVDPGARPTEPDAGPFARLSDDALRVLVLAQEEALRLGHAYIGTEHVLLGLLREPENGAALILGRLGVEFTNVRMTVEFITGRGERAVAGPLGFSPRAQKVVMLALDEAQTTGQSSLAGTEHLLVGIVGEGEGIAMGVLESLGVGPDKIRSQVLDALSQQQGPAAPARVSQRANTALLQAQLVASWYYHPRVDTEHLLVGLVRERGCRAARVLEELGVELSRVLESFEALAPRVLEPPASGGIRYTLAARTAIDRATLEATQRDHRLAGTGHLLLGVVSTAGGQAMPLLASFGVSPELVRQRLEPLLSSEGD